jgi:hypothetical protein
MTVVVKGAAGMTMGPSEMRPFPQVAVTVVVSGELCRPPAGVGPTLTAASAGTATLNRAALNTAATAPAAMTPRKIRMRCMAW